MIIHTPYGDWEIDEEKVIFLEGPILGFEKIRRYVLLPGGEGIPVFRFQAVDEPSVAFFVVEPQVFCPDYNPNLEKIYGEMGMDGEEERVILSIMTIREDPFSVSVNLRAPLIINARTKKGRQIVLEEERFPVRFVVEKVKEEGDADVVTPRKSVQSLTAEPIKHCG